MGVGRIGVLVFVAAISALLTFVVLRLDQRDVVRCDIHPRLTPAELRTLRANVDRARAAGQNTVLADTRDQQAAFKAAEQSARDEFTFDLRNALGAEYERHRQALDGCF